MSNNDGRVIINIDSNALKLKESYFTPQTSNNFLPLE